MTNGGGGHERHVTVTELDSAAATTAAAVAHHAILHTSSDHNSEQLHTTLNTYATAPVWATLIETRTVYGATLGGRLVGVAAVHEQAPGIAYLSMCNVIERRRGIGTLLVAARLDWAAHHRCRLARAHVDNENIASIANLTRHGFAPVADNGTVTCFEVTVADRRTPDRQANVRTSPHRR